MATTVPVAPAATVLRNEPQNCVRHRETFEVLPVNDAPQFSGGGPTSPRPRMPIPGAGRGVVSVHSDWADQRASRTSRRPRRKRNDNARQVKPLRFENPVSKPVIPILFDVDPNAVVNNTGTACN